MKPKKILLSLLAVALATAVTGVWMTSCSPAPEQGGGGEDITISKTLLFENTSPVASNFLRAVYYERTATAHKFYVKTTFAITNYKPDLSSTDPDMFGNDIWGLLIIAIDRNDVNAPTNNIVRLGKTAWGTTDTKVFTADPSFQFDAMIRVVSHGSTRNSNDGLPLIVENDNVLLEFLKSTTTASEMVDKAFWEVVNEKKYQGGPNDAPSVFLSGSFYTATNQQNNRVYRLDANLTYNSSTGEYVFTIPFTVIDANNINKIAVFGLQNTGWRGGNKTAVIKPLGSSKTIVYADANDVIKGLPVVTVPKNKDERPTLIQGVFQDIITSFSTTIVDAKTGVVTNTNSITLLSSTSNASNIIVFTGPRGSSIVNITNWLYYKGTNLLGEYEYTNTIVLIYSADSSGGADFYAGTNYRVLVSAGNGGTVTISVTVEPTVSLTLPIVAPGSLGNATVTVVDGYSAGDTLTIVNSNTGRSHTVNISGTGATKTGTFTIGEPSTANLVASNGHVIFAIYNDTTSGKAYTNTASFTVVPLPHSAVTNVNPNVGHWGENQTVSNLIVGFVSNSFIYIEVWARADGNSLIVTIGNGSTSGSYWLGDDDWYGDGRWAIYTNSGIGKPYQLKLARYDFNSHTALLDVRTVNSETATSPLSSAISINAGQVGTTDRYIAKVWIPYSSAFTNGTNINVAAYIVGGGAGWASSGIPSGIIHPQAGTSGGSVTNFITNYVSITLY